MSSLAELIAIHELHGGFVRNHFQNRACCIDEGAKLSEEGNLQRTGTFSEGETSEYSTSLD